MVELKDRQQQEAASTLASLKVCSLKVPTYGTQCTCISLITSGVKTLSKLPMIAQLGSCRAGI